MGATLGELRLGSSRVVGEQRTTASSNSGDEDGTFAHRYGRGEPTFRDPLSLPSTPRSSVERPKRPRDHEPVLLAYVDMRMIEAGVLDSVVLSRDPAHRDRENEVKASVRSEARILGFMGETPLIRSTAGP